MNLESLGLFIITTSILLFASMGCGERGPITFPVIGKVIDKNGKPWNGGTIQFTSIADAKIVATGKINVHGEFQLETHFVNGVKGQTKPGAVEGEHHVMIDKLKLQVSDKEQNAIRPSVIKKTYHVNPTNNEFTIETN